MQEQVRQLQNLLAFATTVGYKEAADIISAEIIKRTDPFQQHNRSKTNAFNCKPPPFRRPTK